MTPVRLLLLCAVLLPGTAFAHALAPMLLAVEERGDGHYTLEWQRAPADAWGAQVRPALPAGCRLTQAWQEHAADARRLVSRAEAHCTRARGDIRIAIPGLDRHPGTVVVRLTRADGGTRTLLLAGERDRFALAETDGASRARVFRSYLAMGVEHLVGGPDHLLFVVGLFLLVQGLRSLLWVTAAFTLGHSVTLGLATLGLVRMPQALAELGIALSIVLLGVQVLHRMQGQGAGVWSRRPAVFAAGFGLLHGLGFAGALAEVGLPQGEVPLALFSFNIGIELGQIAVIVPLWLLRRALHARFAPGRVAPRPALALVPYVIGTLGAFWCIDRAVNLVVLV